MHQSHRLLQGGRQSGRAAVDVREDADGVSLAFDAAFGYPDARSGLRGTAELGPGPELTWRRIQVETTGSSLVLEPDGDEQVEIAGVPSLWGIVAMRLRGSGLRPGQERELKLLRVDPDLAVRRVAARLVWIGGQGWKLRAPGEATWLEIRLDGVVRVVEGSADLVE